MKRLQEEYKDTHDFYFIIGTDLIPYLSKWDEGDRMLQEVKFVMYLRQSHPIDLSPSNPQLPKHFVTIDPSKQIIGMISSTEVRNRIKEMKKQVDKEEQLKSELLTNMSAVDDSSTATEELPNIERRPSQEKVIIEEHLSDAIRNGNMEELLDENIQELNYYFHNEAYSYKMSTQTPEERKAAADEERVLYVYEGRKRMTEEERSAKECELKQVTKCKFMNVSGLITKSVLKYILDNKLY